LKNGGGGPKGLNLFRLLFGGVYSIDKLKRENNEYLFNKKITKRKGISRE
jgi:hypothetical protein